MSEPFVPWSHPRSAVPSFPLDGGWKSGGEGVRNIARRPVTKVPREDGKIMISVILRIEEHGHQGFDAFLLFSGLFFFLFFFCLEPCTMLDNVAFPGLMVALSNPFMSLAQLASPRCSDKSVTTRVHSRASSCLDSCALFFLSSLFPRSSEYIYLVTKCTSVRV